MRSTRVQSSSLTRTRSLRTRSKRTDVTNVPKADSTLGCGGTITSELCNSAATSQAWTGPAPPNANSGMPRQSTPRSVAWVRTAAAIDSVTTRKMPRAAWAVASRTRCGARTVGAYFEQTKVVDPGDTAATCADFNHVDRRDGDGQAAALLEAPSPVHFKQPGD